MYNILLIEKLLLYSYVCLFVLNNANSVTGDIDLSFTYDLIEVIVNRKLNDLAGELKADIKRIDDRCADIEQHITDLKAVSAEATAVENNDVTEETLSQSAQQQMDKLSIVIYRTLYEEKKFIRNKIVGLEDRINEFEKSVTDNYQLLANNVSDISRQVTINTEQTNVNGVNVNQLNCSMEDTRNKIVGLEDRINEFEKSVTDNYQFLANNVSDISRQVTINTEQNNVNGVNVNQLNYSMEEARKDLITKTREMQTYIESGFKTIQAEIIACLPNPCIHGTCRPEKNNKYTCMCDNGYTGSICETVMATDCYNIKKLTHTAMDGVYTIQPTGWNATMVYCDMTTTGGGWTVFQNRYDGSLDFYRNFSDYENGFGDLNKEFWLGLKIIRKLVENTRSELRLDLTAADDTHAYEIFLNFSIDASPKYTLHIDSGHGTAGDSYDYGLSNSNNRQFATYDRDSYHNRASTCRGGWWYNYCSYANLNGHYGTPGAWSSYHYGVGGVIYYDFKMLDSLKTTKVMFRRS